MGTVGQARDRSLSGRTPVTNHAEISLVIIRDIFLIFLDPGIHVVQSPPPVPELQEGSVRQQLPEIPSPVERACQANLL